MPRQKHIPSINLGACENNGQGHVTAGQLYIGTDPAHNAPQIEQAALQTPVRAPQN